MSATILPPNSMATVDPAAVQRKVFWRVVPLIFVLYVIAYLDRANAGFAKLQMQEDLGFSENVFGWGFGIFFAGYLLLEIPGALLVEHWSARKWFARILVTWGFCSMGMALVRTPGQFYLARFLLGLAEAGFFPGIIVYFTHWFPQAYRGRAMAGMVLGVPISLAVGARVSGWLLELDLWGLAGWQWVFLVEGFPAVAMGLCLPWLMTDRPAQARWLSQSEREWLEESLASEQREAAAAGGAKLSQALRQPVVWLLAMGILAANTGGYAMLFWLPTVVKNLLLETHRAAEPTNVLNWTSLTYASGLLGVWAAGRLSHRLREWKWLCAAAMMLTGTCLIASAWPGQPWLAIIAWLCLVGFFGYFWPTPFWVLPTLSLSASAAAVSIGFINMCANLAGLLGSPIVGRMKTAGFQERTCLQFLAACYILGGVLIAFIRVSRSAKTPQVTK